jgi:hypothetical protein
MLQIVILLGWVLALVLVVFLATESLRHRRWGRQRRKRALRRQLKFKRHHHFDPKRGRWVRNDDGSVVVDETADDRRLVLILVGCLLLIVWEGYWISEIIERFSRATHPLQLPYGFLLFMLVGVPLAVYLYFRRRLRRSVRIPI